MSSWGHGKMLIEKKKKKNLLAPLLELLSRKIPENISRISPGAVFTLQGPHHVSDLSVREREREIERKREREKERERERRETEREREERERESSSRLSLKNNNNNNNNNIIIIIKSVPTPGDHMDSGTPECPVFCLGL